MWKSSSFERYNCVRLGYVPLVIASRPKKESLLSLTALPATSAYTPTALGDDAKRSAGRKLQLGAKPVAELHLSTPI